MRILNKDVNLLFVENTPLPHYISSIFLLVIGILLLFFYEPGVYVLLFVAVLSILIGIGLFLSAKKVKLRFDVANKIIRYKSSSILHRETKEYKFKEVKELEYKEVKRIKHTRRGLRQSVDVIANLVLKDGSKKVLSSGSFSLNLGLFALNLSKVKQVLNEISDFTGIKLKVDSKNSNTL